jgi:hypothetical protein
LDLQNQRIGITTQQGMFTIQNIVNYPYFPLVTDLDRDMPVLRDLEAISFPYVSPLLVDEKGADGYELKVLARTSKNSWLDPEPAYVSPMREYSAPPGQSTGTFVLMALVDDMKTPFRMLVSANGRFIQRDFMVTESNAGMFLNAVDWLTEDEELISIRTKGVGERPLKGHNASSRMLVKNVNILLIPLLVLCAGVYRWRSSYSRALKIKRKILGE